VGLLRVRNRLASQLSGGMKRRLSIAIALIGTARASPPLLSNAGIRAGHVSDTCR
jgi:ABC-type glutathione transport system ATPase component